MRHHALFLGLCILLAGGCQKHPLTDYRPIDQAGMWSGSIEQLKQLNISDLEIAQLVKLKQAGVSDDTCVALIDITHQQHKFFAAADSVISLGKASFSEPQVLEITKADKLESLTPEIVTLRLIGLSDATVQMLLKRHLQDQPTLSSGEISRLKNTGLTEKQIVDRINQGMTDQQADKEITARETMRNHANTGFVRIHGRKPR